MRVKKGYATRRGKIVVEDAAAYVCDLAQRLEARGRLGATRSFIQHGDVSVYDHVLAVARTSICMARVLSRVGIAVDAHAFVRHMFPLVPIPPACREAWIVCLADKACALGETIDGRIGGSRQIKERGERA